jgi:signal transduction histidine kinase
MVDKSVDASQFALLNELAMAASAGVDTGAVAQKVVQRLRNTFDTEQAKILLLMDDGETLLEYGGIEGSEPLVIPVSKSLAGYVVEKQIPIRLGDITQAPRFYPPAPEVRSGLFVPLMYRRDVIGTICLQSNENDAFTARDEQLLTVIASHLAGLLKNVRLNQEARERAGKLDLIHRVAERVVGLTDEREVAQLTAELTADYFKYELAVILIAAPNQDDLTVFGAGGSMAHLVPKDYSFSVTRGITGHVFRHGKGEFYNDVSLSDVYFPLPGWQAGSEMCVPLWDGEKVMGVINAEREERHSFTSSDLQVFESLAGILSSVILSARRYRELQERIEAQRQAENHLIRSARLAAVGEMAAGVAHELNNPLTSVIGFIELALDELPSESMNRKELELALREAQRARQVVRRLLDFSRQSGNIRVSVDINELLRDSLQLMEHQLQSSGIQIQMDLTELSPVQVNPNQIKQVILNLLQNALQAMPGGGILIISSAAADHSGEPGASFSISDTGEGIPLENQSRIFEPFFTTRTVGEGTGLGLSVSYGIINSHGGQIDVKSAPGHGSCFCVWLPFE